LQLVANLNSFKSV